MYFFDQVEILIGNTGILAESCSISSENSLEPVKILGRFGEFNQIPFGPLKHQINISYTPQIGKEPFINLLSGIRDLTGSSSGILVKIAGVEFSGSLLTSYSLDLSTNSLARVSVAMDCYNEPIGTFATKVTGVSGDRTAIPHSWTTYITDSNGNNAQISDLSYNFRATWEPFHILGRRTPLFVDFLGATEEFTAEKISDFFNLKFSGLAFTGEFLNSNAENISMKTIGFLISGDNASISYNIVGAKMKKAETSIRLDDIIRTRGTAYKYY